MKLLVTGVAGFIGLHTTLRLLAAGHEVVGVDNLNDYYDPRLKLDRLDCLLPHPGFHFFHQDIELSFLNFVTNEEFADENAEEEEYEHDYTIRFIYGIAP